VDVKSEDANQAAQRLVGSFAGWSGPNDFRIWGPGIMHCCTANCSRALYFVWDRIIEKKGDDVQVNLLLNRVADDALIRSYLPYEGRIEVVMRRSKGLRIRIPNWIDKSTIKVVNAKGNEILTSWKTPFLTIDRLAAGEAVVLRFELPEYDSSEQVGHIKAVVRFRGNEVIKFDPPGRDNPFWEHKRVDLQQCPETVGSYFVPESQCDFIGKSVTAVK
jgi:hypothetical protein